MPNHTRLKFLILLLMINGLAFSKPNRAEGYIITNDRDTLYGMFKLKTGRNGALIYSRLQEKVTFISREGAKLFLLPGDILSFHFFYNYETLTFSTVPYFATGKLFMKVISEDGYLKLYQFYFDKDKRFSSVYELADYVYSPESVGEPYFFYILKPDRTALWLGRHTPKSRISDFFKDYPELSAKIDSKEYKYTDVFRIVREYNAWKRGEIPGGDTVPDSSGEKK